MKYKVKKVSIKEVVEQLNVEWVLEGSVQLEGEKIQVTAQLINAVKDVHIWRNFISILAETVTHPVVKSNDVHSLNTSADGT